MKYILLCGILFIGCAPAKRLVPINMANYIERSEFEKTIQKIKDQCVNQGDVLSEIEKHRKECLHACDCK